MKSFTYYMARIGNLYRGNLKANGVIGILKLTYAIGLCAAGPVYSRIGFEKRYCPSCGWAGANFLPFLATGYTNFQVRCPRCQCHPRHRAHQLFYKNNLRLMEKKGKLLYFAPESNVNNLRNNKNLEVRTSNYRTNTADYDIDIMQIQFEDNSWDYIICHRVIEHIPDDVLGMEELFRVLKPSGILILSVPIDDTLETTIEYGEPNPMENDHYYNYALDFEQRIPKVFDITRYKFSDLYTEKEFKAMALQDDYLFICRKPG